MAIQWMVDQLAPKGGSVESKKARLLEELQSLSRGRIACEKERHIAWRLYSLGVGRREIAKLLGRAEETIRTWV